MTDAEQDLTGGNVNAVVRVGDTVRRTAGPWTPTIHALLAWVRAHGVERVPAPLGRDEQGREVLSYLPGTVGQGPDGGWVWTPSVLHDAGRLLRAWHDASAGFALDGAVWRLAPAEPAEVVCLNDVAPYNMVGGADGLAGFIDVDMASPGPRVRDLAYLSYRLCPFAEDAAAPPGTDRWQRLEALLDAYGRDRSPASDDVVRAIAPRILELATWTDHHAAATGNRELIEHAAMYRRDADRIAATAAARG